MSDHRLKILSNENKPNSFWLGLFKKCGFSSAPQLKMAAASILLLICKMSHDNAPRGPADRKMSSRSPGKTHHKPYL